MRLRDLLDPDTDWRSLATLQHFAACVFLGGLFLGLMPYLLWLVMAEPTGAALLLVFWTASVYEAGQTDTAYSLRDGAGRRYAGQPGYGFGLMDLAAGMIGAIVGVLLYGALVDLVMGT